MDRAPELTFSQDLKVGLDYGVFYLHTGLPDYETLPTLGDGTGIAQDEHSLVVPVPHQCNFALPLQVEVWSDRPTEDLDDWQEAAEAFIEVGPAGLTYESPTVAVVEIAVPPGRYHVLITGKGIVGRGWVDEPADEWRIRLSSSSELGEPRSVKAFVDDKPENPWAVPTPYQIGGEHAADRIRDDLDRRTGARTLSGASGIASVDQVIPYSRRRVFGMLAEPYGWLTWDGTWLGSMDAADGGARILVGSGA